MVFLWYLAEHNVHCLELSSLLLWQETADFIRLFLSKHVDFSELPASSVHVWVHEAGETTALSFLWSQGHQITCFSFLPVSLPVRATDTGPGLLIVLSEKGQEGTLPHLPRHRSGFEEFHLGARWQLSDSP
jgi:hypothetical protein